MPVTRLVELADDFHEQRLAGLHAQDTVWIPNAKIGYPLFRLTALIVAVESTV